MRTIRLTQSDPARRTGRLLRTLVGALLTWSVLMPAAADDAVRNYLLVSNREGSNVLRYDRDTGALVDTLIAAGSGGLGVPYGMDVGPDGHLYVASISTELHATTPQVLKYNLYTGEFLGVAVPPQPDLNPLGVTFGPDEDLFVTSRNSSGSPGQVLRFDMPGATPLGDFIQGEPSTLHPSFSTFGPDGKLYVTTPFNGVSLFDGTTGASLGKFPTPGMSSAGQVQFTPDGSKIYITDYFSPGLHVFDAATGNALGILGPGNLGMRFDSKGILFVADYWGNSLYRYEGAAWTSFAAGGALNGPLDIVLYSIPEPREASLLMMVAAGGWVMVRRWRRVSRGRGIPNAIPASRGSQ